MKRLFMVFDRRTADIFRNWSLLGAIVSIISTPRFDRLERDVDFTMPRQGSFLVDHRCPIPRDIHRGDSD